jgi:F-type H+-transporting ATPase subunit a
MLFNFKGGIFMSGIDPLHQFEIMRLVPFHLAGFDVSFTNSSLWMMVALLLTSALIVLPVQARALVPGRMHLLVENIYSFVASTVKSVAGEDAMRYFPWLFSLFLLVLSSNIIGLIPYSFTATSHLAVTGALALFVFLTVATIGFVRNGFGYLSIFVPSGLPLAILPLVVVIEIISYLSRPLTHSMRLLANMMAGHIMMKVLGGFVTMMGFAKGGIAPFLLMVPINALELLTAGLQAYVFTMMTCIYLKDALHPHH